MPTLRAGDGSRPECGDQYYEIGTAISRITSVNAHDLSRGSSHHEKSAMRNHMNPDSASLAALSFIFMVAKVIASVNSPSEVKSAVKIFTEPLLKIQSLS